MYIWRVPRFAFVALVASAALVLTLTLILRARTYMQRVLYRGVLSALAVLVVCVSPFLIGTLIQTEIDSAARHGVYIDPSSALLYSPVFYALLIVASGKALFPPRPTANSVKWRNCYSAMCLMFAFLNLINWCSLDWCEHFGFPFAYSWRSDVILVFNGQNLSAGASVAGITWNGIILCGLAAFLSFKYRRQSGVTV